MKEFKFNKDVSDKYIPKTLYKAGSVHTFEDKRAEELLKAGVGEIVGKIEKVQQMTSQVEELKAKEVIVETAEADKSKVEVAAPKRKRATKAK